MRNAHTTPVLRAASLVTLLALGITNPVSADRAMSRVGERLDRGVVAMATETGYVYVGWRLLQSDPAEIAFNVYRAMGDGEPVKLNAKPITATTDFVDRAPGDASTARYWVCPVVGGDELAPSRSVTASNVQGQPYISLRLQGDYTFQKAGIADLNGDGCYDFVIKQPNTNIDPYEKYWKPSEGTYKIEAYLDDGTFLWRRDLSWAIECGIWYSPYLVYDFDGDGKAEVAVKTGEGDPRGPDGRVSEGPEYLSIWDGMTGRETARVEWPSRGGDIYNFFSRNQLGVAYLDGKTPAVLVARGTYGAMELVAYEYDAGRLRELWRWTNPEDDVRFAGQGAHFMHSADVDADGKEEVVLGACVIDDDGRGLWSTGMFHCDHAYVGDIDPQRPGLEVYYGYERPKPINGVCLVDARTGETIWGLKERTYHVHSSGLCSDIDQAHPGMECYSGERDYPMRRLHAANGELLATESAFDVGLSPRAVYWDADAQRELLHGGRVYDYDTGLTHLADIAGHQAAWADIFGDWREEIVTSVAGELRIYTTTVPATDRRVTLMQDPIYRADVAHLAMGYAQVPMTSYCLDARERP